MFLCELFKLPFHLQVKIMSFHPRLPRLNRSFVIVGHLSRKYCKKCGEYMERLKHAHEPLARYKKKEYKYMSVNLTLTIHLNYIKKSCFSIPFKTYLNLIENCNQVPFRAVFLKTGIQNFYSFKNFCNLKSKRIIPMIDICQLNIFRNPNTFTITEFVKNNPEFSLQQVWNSRCMFTTSRAWKFVHDSHHLKTIQNIMSQITMYDDNYIYFFYKSILSYECLLESFLKISPKNTINLLSDFYFTRDKYFLKAIEMDFKCIEHIPEKRLERLFKKNRRFFIDLYESEINIKEYYTLVNILEETLEPRLGLL